MRKTDWMPSSQKIDKDQFNNDIFRTIYRVRALLNDGHVVWKGIFHDRDDFDAFLRGIFTGSLQYDRSLWRLPNFEWHPGIGEGLVYDFATVTFLTSASGTYTSPSDWDSSNNFIEMVGSGGSGGVAGFIATSNKNTGGGGGEYRKTLNFPFASPGTTTAAYAAAAGGAAVNSSNSSDGNDGASSTFSTFSAGGGKKGLSGTTTTVLGGAGGSGGTGAGGNFNGGAGGDTSFSGTATGAGGAAGLNGAGVSGSNASSANTASAGGSGDNGSGGSGGSSSGGNGGNGTEWDATHGSGGGSGGKRGSQNSSLPGATPGNYGAGSGAVLNTGFGNGASITGAQGLVVVTYVPFTGVSGLMFNMSMLGM